jgi:magnesium transporter
VIRAWRYREGSDCPDAVELDPFPAVVDGELLWIDCDQPDETELEALGKQLQLHKFILEDLEHGEQRTKLDHYDNHFHVAVHDCELIGDLEQTTGEVQLLTREIDVVFGAGWLLSVCQVPEDSSHGTFPMDKVRSSFERQRTEPGTTDEGFLLWALLDVVVDRYFLVSDSVDDRLDALQEVVLDDSIDRIRRGRPRELFDLSKALMRFRRATLPLREVVGQLLRRDDPDISDISLAHFQDLYDHVLRAADLAESQRDVLTGLRDADLAVTSNQMSLIQQKIAAWGAILIVATLVTGFLGMNFRDAPNTGWISGFAIILGVMAALCLPMYIYAKRRKWL